MTLEHTRQDFEARGVGTTAITFAVCRPVDFEAGELCCSASESGNRMLISQVDPSGTHQCVFGR